MIIDGSTVNRFTGIPANGTPITSSSFNAPAGSKLIVCAGSDSVAGTSVTLTVSGGGLSWVREVQQLPPATFGGQSEIWSADVSSLTNLSVSLSRTGSGSTNRLSAKVYIVTGQAVSPLGNETGGTSTTENLTTSSLTTTGTNSAVFASAVDWAASGNGSVNPSSSDMTADPASYNTQIDVLSGYKTVASAGSTTVNLNAAGTPASAQWVYALLEIKDGVGTLEQSAFRFRNDDGSETTATWAAAENTNATIPNNTLKRLRTILNATGDLTGIQYQVEYSVNDGPWRRLRGY